MHRRLSRWSPARCPQPETPALAPPPSSAGRGVPGPLRRGRLTASRAYVNRAISVITCRQSKSGTEQFGKLPEVEQHAGGGVWIRKREPPSLPGWRGGPRPPSPPCATQSRTSPPGPGSPETQWQCPGLPRCKARVSTSRAPPRDSGRLCPERVPARQGSSRALCPRAPGPTCLHTLFPTADTAEHGRDRHTLRVTA